jgi:hypothetical protein
MSCGRSRSEVRDVALGVVPSRRLQAHLASCPTCRAVLVGERRRLAEIDDELGQALAVEPSPSLLPRVREAVSRQLAEPRSRFVWLLPVAASLVALAVLLPLTRHIAPATGGIQALPSPLATASEPAVSEVEVPANVAPPEVREDSRSAPARALGHRRAAPRVARATSEPEVIVPPGGEAAFRRYVQAIRHSRVVDQVVLGPGPDPVDWTEPASMRQQPRAIDRFPGEMEPPTADAEALTLGD